MSVGREEPDDVSAEEDSSDGTAIEQPEIITTIRESLQDEYDIYLEQGRLLGWDLKSFEEWLQS